MYGLCLRWDDGVWEWGSGVEPVVDAGTERRCGCHIGPGEYVLDVAAGRLAG